MVTSLPMMKVLHVNFLILVLAFVSTFLNQMHFRVCSDAHKRRLRLLLSSISELPTMVIYKDIDVDTPANIENWKPNNRPVLTYEARQVHYNNVDFPVVPPNYYVNQDTVGKESRPRFASDVHQVDDPGECRERFLKLMQEHRQSNSNTFMTNRKHYVPGTGYKQIEGNFYIPPMQMGEKYRIKVSIEDEWGNHDEYSYIEFAHTPLWRSGRGNKRTLAKNLYDNTMTVDPQTNDVRPKTLSGGMSASGARLYKQEIIPYKNTHPSQKGLLTSAATWFGKYGFFPWTYLLWSRMEDLGPQAVCPSFGQTPFCSLLVMTSNYGNECHQDTMDNCQALTIWH